MTDLDPAIWENETLGSAAQNTRLDVIEKQELENRNARIEDREPRPVVVDNDYPGWQPNVNPRTGTIPSNIQVVHFADEQQNDIPVDSGPSDETAFEIAEDQQEAEETQEAWQPENSSQDEEVESPVIGSTEESSESTEWK